MERVTVIGNSGGGKSMLARRLAARLRLPYVEVDSLLWLPGWQPAAPDVYEREHARRIAEDRWLIDGLGTCSSIPARFARSTAIVVVDLPLWVHYWLAAERQIAWSQGPIDHPPAGIRERPPTDGLFRTMWEIDRDWMPEIRVLAEHEQAAGKRVFRLGSLEELDGFASRPDL